MFGLTFLGDVLVFIAGGALVWFCKDRLIQWWKGTEKFIADAKAKIAALEAKASAIKSAVSS